MNLKLIGPFKQLLNLKGLPLGGPLKDEQLKVIEGAGILCGGGQIIETGTFLDLAKKYQISDDQIDFLAEDMVALPGFIDAHTHICYAGNRASDFAARNNGKTYQDIAAAGGGIWSTVKHTRAASQNQLVETMQTRSNRLLTNGITTVEIKSGYGLSVKAELKMLRAIKELHNSSPIDVISTCLAAHIIPKDFDGGEEAYLDYVLSDLVPLIKSEQLTSRFDIFVEDNAYTYGPSKNYLFALKDQGFSFTIHGDQFTVGGSKLAVECGAISVDHLEVSGDAEIALLANSNVIPTALPGASIGIGCPFTPARRLLDSGCSLAIASDWNPGSAPMGDLLTQASILATYEKLSAAEVLSGITFRAATALELKDRGILAKGMLADIVAFPSDDFRDILYHQGSMKPLRVWKRGVLI